VTADPDLPEVDLSALARSFADLRSEHRVKSGYLRWFLPGARVLDVGCGHGAFLDVAREAGLRVSGIDASPHAVDSCARRGHDVTCDDAVRGLRARATEPLDGVLCAHLIEHLDGSHASRLIAAAAGALRPRGVLVLVTPNYRSPIVQEEVFWLDPTHVRPYPRALLERLCVAAGLQVVASLDDPASRPRRVAWRRWVAKARALCGGVDRTLPLDSIVVAVRAGPATPQAGVAPSKTSISS
jgi:2-polyprenyl-3-methyl-5-hydroxy-6-metoxy-1,4-benzoquinol methylase